MPPKMNQEQVKSLLKLIDATADETDKADIFTELGEACFRRNHLQQWVDEYKGDTQRFLDSVNIQHESEYWESLVLSADGTHLTLTGREVDRCACAFADCSAPPLSLCNYCCKSFQSRIFGALLGRQVQVTITESYLRGDRRCSTVIEMI